MDRNSNSDIEVEPYEEIVRSVSYPNPMDARSLNSSAGLTFQTTVCEPIFSNGRDELGNAHSTQSTVLSTSVPWPALRPELGKKELRWSQTKTDEFPSQPTDTSGTSR